MGHMAETLRISVIGTGYLGATHAAAMAEMGYSVVGIDIDATKVESLSKGSVPFYEPGLDELITSHVDAGRLRFTTDFAEAAGCDVHFICVGTPQIAGSNAADMRWVDGAVEALAPHLAGPALVVGKSTVPVGTAARLREKLATLAPAGADAHLAWNPEFLREGFAVEDTLRPDRIVVGVADPADEATLRRVYAPQLARDTPMLVTDYATAELVKVAANAFLATKISFINAMAEICEVAGADVTMLADAIGYDARIGRKFLGAGIGFGGGCLPKDIRAFMARAGELGVGPSLSFLREVDEINMRRRARVTEIAREVLGGSPLGARVAVLGVAFKPDSDDVRDSPALNIAAALHLQGAQVRVYDPKAMENAARAFPTLTYVPTTEAALTGADLVLLLTEWKQFIALDPSAVGEQVARRNIVDGRNVLDPLAWRAAGWHYRGIGRP
jgi:UDPglucose 6-dehydrogenase